MKRRIDPKESSRLLDQERSNPIRFSSLDQSRSSRSAYARPRSRCIRYCRSGECCIRKVWYHQIWIQTYLGFIVLILMKMSERIFSGGPLLLLRKVEKKIIPQFLYWVCFTEILWIYKMAKWCKEGLSQNPLLCLSDTKL